MTTAAVTDSFGNIFASELTGLTDDQVVALCSRHLSARLASLSSAGASKSALTRRRIDEEVVAEEAADEDPLDEPDVSEDDELTEEDSDAGQDGADEEPDDADEDNAMFRGGDLDEAEQEEMLAMEAEEADGGAEDEDDSDADEALAARFDREDLPFDSLKFDDFIDPNKRPRDRPPDEEDDEAAESGDSDVAAAEKGPKSKFERSQERMRQEIAALEDSLVRPAPWQLRGEIEAADRPEGGLLDEDLDFDHIGRPRPLASEDLESRIQDLVRSRIKDAAFDSVTRKHRPEERPAEYRKALLLDTEKPRPLAEVYESEFAKQQAAEEAKSLPQHDEIRRDLNALLARLDRLSGLHFAPQNPLPRVRVVSGAPALAMEEVRGTATATAASQAAPEQLADKPGKRAGKELGDSELSRTDRLRQRRKAKKGARLRKQRAAAAGLASADPRQAALAQLKQQARKPGSRVRILAS